MKRMFFILMPLVLVSLASGDLLTSDTFDGTSLDTAKWNYKGSSSVTTEGSGYVTVNLPLANTSNCGIVSNATNYQVHTENDFSISIDYKLVSTGTVLTYEYIYFYIDSNGHSLKMERRTNSALGSANFRFFIDGVQKTSLDNQTLVDGVIESMKFERVGDTLTGYGKTSGGWMSVGSWDASTLFASFDSASTVGISYSHPTDRSGKLMIDTFDITQIPEPVTTSAVLSGVFLLSLRRNRKNR